MTTTDGIVEDDAVLRKTLMRLVGESQGFRCVAAYASGEEALERLSKLQPHVVLMDLNLPRMPGIECIRRLKESLPKTPVIVLTVYEDGEHIFRALKAGACGYLLKRSEPDQVLDEIWAAREGGALLSSADCAAGRALLPRTFRWSRDDRSDRTGRSDSFVAFQGLCQQGNR